MPTKREPVPVLDETPEAKAYAAKEVQLLLSKEVVKQAFATTETRIKDDWARAQTAVEREQYWAELQAFKKFQVVLRSIART